jgi:hypothetical protein
MSTTENTPQNQNTKRKLFWLERFGMKSGNRKFWNSDKLLSLFAFLISVGTFATFAYQTYLISEQQELIRKEQYASVLPYLTIYTWNGGLGDASVRLVNNGVGPAFIDAVKIYYNDTTYNFGTAQFFQELINLEGYPRGHFNISSMGIATGMVIPAGQEVELIGSNNKATEEKISELFFGDDSEKAKIEITYSSVYEETWVIRSFSYVPEKLE